MVLAWAHGYDVRPLSAAATAAVAPVAVALHRMELGRAMVPSDTLLFYWPMAMISTTMKLFSLWKHDNLWSDVGGADKAATVLYALSLLNDVAIFVLEYALPKLRPRRVKLEVDDDGVAILADRDEYALLENADVYSRISLTWINDIIVRAAGGLLTLDQLPPVDNEYSTERTSEKFHDEWRARRDDSVWSLVWAIARAFGSTVALSGVFEFAGDLIGFAQPFLLRYLILFANSYWEQGAQPQPVEIGMYIALGMLSANILRTIFGANLLLYLIRTASMVKGSLYSALFDKSLILSSKERQGRSAGEIVNLMAVDVQTITNIVWMVTTLWEAPIQFAICLYSLNVIVGRSMWAAVGVLLLFLPLNTYMMRKIKDMRKKQMKYKDERTRLTTEILSNIKSIKLYSWEPAMLQRLDNVRNNLQLHNLRDIILFSSLIDFVWSVIPYCISCSTFAVFAYIEDVPLTPEIVFPCISLFDMMTAPLNDIPRVVTRIVDSSVSFQRIRDFLVSEEMQHDAVARLGATTMPGDKTVEVKGDATFVWDRNNPDSVVLEKINYVARKGELSCIVGRVGSGKTAFLRSLLGELDKVQGSVVTRGSVAYVAQDPWLMNASVKQNILFGNRYEPEFYQRTLEACALGPDLQILPDGDDTEVGERGVSLSGGQKARLSLARAVYARADVYLLDDPLSAVDEHVRRQIVEQVLSATGVLATKTRILCTNAISVLSRADNIVLLENCTIAERGTLSAVLERKGHIYDLLREFGRKDLEINSDLGDSDESLGSNGDDQNAAKPLENGNNRRGSVDTLRRASIASYTRGRRSHDPNLLKRRTAQRKEAGEKGRVKWHVYKRYVAACGITPIVVSLVLIVLASLQALAANFWLKAWVENNARVGQNVDRAFWLGGFFIIGSTAGVISVGRKITGRIYCGLRASRILHDKMAATVLRSPMVFFETTPIGRIINRFSSDINELDEGLPVAFIDLLRTLVKILVSIGVVIYAAPAILGIMIPLSVLYYYYQTFYQGASRELKRLLSISRSPIFSHFQESLNGISTIRAFGREERFKSDHIANLDGNIRAIYLFRSANRWLTFRLQTIGALIVFTTAVVIVFGSTTQAFTPGLIGIMMTYIEQMTDFFSWIVKAYVNLETSVVGVERVLEYADLPTEAPEIVSSQRPAQDWPAEGRITYKNYSTKYRPNLDLVLKDVDISIKPREKVGIVGRTGAGKSSLILSLFRIIEATSGGIEIDGIDVSQIGLRDLRCRLSIIPQDSQVFEGTIRQNLDPLDEHTDDMLWRALEMSHLKAHVQSMEGGLDAAVSEGGTNLSAGQRQLMCLGRALLHKSSILVLDEATASVDVQTDKLVQKTIRTAFKDHTIVTIAHRLNTILDSDRVLVLDHGRVAEFDTPRNLLQNPDSLFFSLCKQGGHLDEDATSTGSN